MSALSNEERAVLRASLGFGDHAADIIEASHEVLLDLRKNPIGKVEQCTRSACKVVRIRVLRNDKPSWKYVWPRKDARHSNSLCTSCIANAGGGHAFVVQQPARPY